MGTEPLKLNVYQHGMSLLLLVVLLVAGCAPQQQAVRKRYFWPPSFEVPKIEYINFYLTDQDIKRGTTTWMDTAVLGLESPKLVFSRPNYIASDSHGRVFVGDQVLRKVLIWDFGRHEIRDLHDALGEVYVFGLPAGIVTLPDRSVAVVDAATREILVFGPDEHLAYKFSNPQIQRPSGIAFDPVTQRFAVVDTGGHAVFFFSLQGEYLQTLGTRGSQSGQFNYPLDADFGRNGELFVLDAMNSRVQVFDKNNRFLRMFGERGTAIGSFQIPKSISVSADAGLVLVSDSLANRFVVFNLEGEHLMTVGGAYPTENHKVAPGGVYLPIGIDIDQNQTIWIVDSLNRMFHQFQYLTDAYLREHPIHKDEVVIPESLKLSK